MSVALKLDACEYKRREPQHDLLHQVLVEHLEIFLDRARTEYHELPKYAPNELRDYVKCKAIGKARQMVNFNTLTLQESERFNQVHAQSLVIVIINMAILLNKVH